MRYKLVHSDNFYKIMGKYIKIQIFIIYFMLLSNITFGYCEENNKLNKNAKIVIIGAGPSGIAAASKLMDNGFKNVIILEAENRIGGRVYTTKLGNYSIDVGGQWVVGNGSIVYEMGKSYNLIDDSEADDNAFNIDFLDSSGNRLQPDLVKKLQELGQQVLVDNFGDNPEGYETFGQFIEKAYDEIFKNDAAMMNNKKRYLDQFESMRITSEASDSWHDISAPGLSEFKEYLGDQTGNWKERGYSTILDLLMKRYPNPENELPVLNNTILNSEVMSIDYLQNVEGPPVLITTTKGQLYKADHVIVTVSLGVLKEKHKSLFIPSLPVYKINTIEATGYGTTAKIYLLFDKPFWNIDDESKLFTFFLMWKGDDIKEIEANPEKNWLVGMSYILTVEHKPNLLELWVSGKHAKQMETLSEEKVMNHSVENIKRFFGKAFNVTTPIAMLRSRWYSNPHFRGVYSYRSVETHKRKVFPEMLARPLNEQNLRVLFAGEATSSHRFGTVDGAVQSGLDAANRLIDHYEK